MQTHYDDACMARTAQFMVDKADSVIAVWNGAPCDVGLAVQMAREKQVSVTVIDPTRL